MTFAYDAGGNRSQRTDYNGAVTNYSYDDLNRLTTISYPDTTSTTYGRNDHGELVSGKQHWSDNSLVWGAQAENNFDDIGNRNYAKNGGNQLDSLRQANYTSNLLNQYSQRSVPGAVDMKGTAMRRRRLVLIIRRRAASLNIFTKN